MVFAKRSPLVPIGPPQPEGRARRRDDVGVAIVMTSRYRGIPAKIAGSCPTAAVVIRFVPFSAAAAPCTRAVEHLSETETWRRRARRSWPITYL
jgi:hypothetical protein